MEQQGGSARWTGTGQGGPGDEDEDGKVEEAKPSCRPSSAAIFRDYLPLWFIESSGLGRMQGGERGASGRAARAGTGSRTRAG